MSRFPALLTVGVLFSGLASTGVGAQPENEPVVGEPQSRIHGVQYDDGGRCYNSCITGYIFARCQTDSRFANRENCCNVTCNRLNNDGYWRN
jgi:hypothetical protein